MLNTVLLLFLDLDGQSFFDMNALDNLGSSEL